MVEGIMVNELKDWRCTKGSIETGQRLTEFMPQLWKETSACDVRSERALKVASDTVIESIACDDLPLPVARQYIDEGEYVRHQEFMVQGQ